MSRSSNPDQKSFAPEILESIADPVVAFDKEYRYTYVSRRAAEALGKRPEEMLGNSIWKLFPDSGDSGAFKDACERAWRTGKPVTVEMHPELLGIFIDLYVFPFDGGATVQWRNVTERKLAEEALRESEERNRLLAGLLATSDQAFGIGYPDGRLGYVNPAIERLTGYTAAEASQLNWSVTITPPEWRELERTKLEQLQRDGMPVRYEKEYIRKDGSRVPVELFVHLTKDETGNPIYYAFVTDLSERKRAEKVARESEIRLRTLSNNLPEAAIFRCSVNAAGEPKIEFISAGIERLTGSPASEFERDWDEVKRCLVPEDYLLLLDAMQQSGTALAHFEAEMRHIHRKSGELRWALIRSTPRRNADGSTSWDGIVLDVSDRKRAEAAVRESEDKLRNAFGHAAIGFAMCLPSCIFVNANPAFCAITGYELSELIGMRNTDLVHPEDVAENAALVSRMLAGEIGHFVIENRYVRKDKTVVWVRKSVSLVREDSGIPKWIIALIEDVTERRRNERALVESESRYRSLFENSMDAVLLTNSSGEVVAANPAACELFRMSEGEIRLAGRSGLLASDQAELGMALEERRRLGHVRGELTFVRKDGTRFEGDVSSVLVDEDDRAFVMIRDITQRKHDERALRESEARFRFVVESGIVGVVFARRDNGDIVSANDEFLRIVGRTRLELESGQLNWRKLTAPEMLERDLAAVDATPVDGRFGPLEKEYVRPDGSRVQVIVTGTHLADARDRTVVVIFDNTEQKRAEERLRQAQKLESIGLLAGGIAHDFNNLLVGVIGSASLALDMIPSGSEAADLIQRVIKIGDQLAHLTRQLLAYSGKGKFIVQALNLSSVAPEIVSLLQPSLPRKVTVHFELDPALPPVMADPGQLQQILMNLVLNASEAMGDAAGTITVRTGVETVDAGFRLKRPSVELADGKYVRLEVQDTGCGMDSATRAKIFEPFFTTKFVGRGLGLAAVSGIVRGHKGAIAVESDPGKGSCFTVFLPVTDAPARPARAVQPVPSTQKTGTILVVDDEPFVLEMAGKALQRYGYTVLSAANATEAIGVLKKHPGEIALALLDLSMPELSGDQALPEFRKFRPEMKVVVSSGYDESQAMAVFRGQHVSAFLQKPYTSAMLLEKIRTALA